MARNVSLACRILRHHNTTRGESADVTIARLEFNLPSEPEYKQSLRRIVPIHFSHAMLYHEAGRFSERRNGGLSLTSFLGCSSYVDIFHVSFAVAIGKNSKTFHTLIVSPIT